MSKKLTAVFLLALGFASTAVLTGCGSAAAYHLAGLHNDNTLQSAQGDYNKARADAAAKLADTAKAGTEMLGAAKQMQDHPQEESTSKLEDATDGYGNSVDRAERQREVYADGLAQLREEVQATKERWADIIQKIGDEPLKNEHQRLMDRRLRNLERKLQAAERGLVAYDTALSRAKDVRLVAASLKEDAVLGRIGDRIDSFAGEVKLANAALVRAADVLLASLQPDESVAGS
jgi:hypothetical protein